VLSQLRKDTAGSNFEKAVIRAVLDRRAEQIKGHYYRQVDGQPSPNALNLYAPDVILMKANFSLPQPCLISHLFAKGKPYY